MLDFKKKFGENLKIIRKARDFTQEQLSELIDIHCRQMSKIETGENFPSSKTIEKLCYALKIPPAVLFDFDFYSEGEGFKTGTDNILCYTAVKNNNVVTLKDYKNKNIIEDSMPIWKSDEKLLKLAKNIKKPVRVEYIEEDKKIKTLVYNPDGSINQINQNEETLSDLFKNIETNKNYVEFIKLAIKSLDDDKALESLELMINGMKLMRKGK